MGGEPGQHQGRQADGPAAAGDGVAQPRHKQQRAHDQQLFDEFAHILTLYTPSRTLSMVPFPAGKGEGLGVVRGPENFVEKFQKNTLQL